VIGKNGQEIYVESPPAYQAQGTLFFDAECLEDELNF
jgi:hypothetical protein